MDNAVEGLRSSSCWQRTRRALFALPLAACFSGCGDHSSPVQHAQFRALGFLPGYTASQASAVATDGTLVAGTAATTAGNRQAFRWTPQQGLTGLGYLPGGTASTATAVSATGAVIVGSGDTNSGSTPTPSAGFRWSADGGAQRIDALPASPLCHAGGVSGDGAVVVGTCLQAGHDTAFRWTAGTGPVALSRFGGGSNQQSSAAAISLDGSVIVGAGHPVLTGAVLWAADGSATSLGKLPGAADGGATAVARDGSVIVGTSTDNAGASHAFRWTAAAGMVDLGDGGSGLGGIVAASVSGTGSIIVGWGPTATGDVALIWDAGRGWRRLPAGVDVQNAAEIADWTLTRATAVSDDGRTIAGYGVNPQGQIEAWIMTLMD